MDKVAKEFNLSWDMDDHKYISISFSLVKLLSPAATVIDIVSIILYATHRIGMTSCNLLALMNLAAPLEALNHHGKLYII